MFENKIAAVAVVKWRFEQVRKSVINNKTRMNMSEFTKRGVKSEPTVCVSEKMRGELYEREREREREG